MNKQYFVSEGQVLDALGIESFRNLSKAKVMEFVSLIPEVDKDVAISIINQFPKYAESAKAMVEQMSSVCENILEENRTSNENAVIAYKSILEDLGSILKKDDLSSDERAQISEKMVDIADKIAAKDTENKKFLEGMFRYGTTVICGVLLLGVIVLGVRVKGVSIPKVA